MIEIVVTVDLQPGEDIIGVKEDITSHLEKFGDIVKVEAKEIINEQLEFC